MLLVGAEIGVVELANLPLVVGIEVGDPVPGILLEVPIPVPTGYVG
jgi:hypothetical protein